jgi:hypothetical protein
MLRTIFKIAVVAQLLIIVGCGTPEQQGETAELNSLEASFQSGQISLSEMLVRKRDIYSSNSNLDSFQSAYFDQIISYAHAVDANRMTIDEFLGLEAGARSQMEAGRSINCIRMRQEQQNRDYSGVDSYSGVVAVISMGALIADNAAVREACS